MKWFGSTRFSLGLVLISLLTSHCGLADNLQGRVVAIADGDTITLLDAQNQQHKIRLAGIDAPEKKQQFGNVAKRRMADMVFGKEVRADAREKNRYGPTIGRVWVASADSKASDCPKTMDAGMALLTLGLAWHYKQYAKEQPEEERGQYAFAEEEARRRRIGLWHDTDPVPPREWRHNKK